MTHRILTNLNNLPQALVDAVAADDYNMGDADISVTALIKPPRMVELERRHQAEIVEDASERIWALFGRIGHRILAESSKTKFTHHRLFASWLGWKISGELDVLNHAAMSDYKFTKVMAVQQGVKEDWAAQLNLYAWLCAQNLILIERMEIVAILRDWNKYRALRESDYPQCDTLTLNVPIWPVEQVEHYLTQRVLAHQAARDSAALPECTASDMWERPSKWAVMQKNRKRAVKLHGSELEAEQHLRMVKDGFVEQRPGSRVRCENYCAASEFCDSWKQYQASHPPKEPQEQAA